MDKKDAFICYCFKDADRARRTKDYLESVGISCWMAPDSIPPGSSVPVAITGGIEASSTFVLLFSKSARDSAWAKNELQFALKKGKTIIPFALDKCELSDEFETIDKRSVIKGSQLNHRSLKKLSATIRAVTGSPGSAASSFSESSGHRTEKPKRRRLKEKLKALHKSLLIGVTVFTLVVGSFLLLLDKLPYWFPDHSKDVGGVTGDCEWTYMPSTHRLIISGEGAMDDYRGDDEDPVPWKPYRKEIQKVTVEKGVTHIGAYAFCELEKTESIHISKTVESIGGYAFEGTFSLMRFRVERGNPSFCEIDSNLYTRDKTVLIKYTPGSRSKKFKLPGSVTTIGTDAFCCSSVKQLNLNHVKHLSDNAVHSCSNLTSLTLSSKTETIEGNPFRLNPALSEIKVSGGCQHFCADDGVLYSKDMSRLVSYPPGKTDPDFTVPDTVSVIGDFAFTNNKFLQSVTLSDGTVSVGDSAFSDCSGLNSVRIPEHLQNLGNRAFEFCDLDRADLPETVRSIGECPFQGNIHLRSIRVSGQNPYYTSENGVLYNHAKTELIQYPSGKETLRFEMPDSVTAVNTGAFGYVGLLKQISISDQVKTIGDDAFIGCLSLTSADVPDSVVSLGEYAFARCTSLNRIRLPETMIRIPEGSFYLCQKLTSVTFSDRLTEIGYQAFSGCSSLNQIELPEGLKVIQANVFLNCLRLSYLQIPASVESLGRFSVGYFINENGLPEWIRTVTVSYTPGSAAESYLRENGFSIPEDTDEQN